MKKRTIKILRNLSIIVTGISIIAMITIFILNGGERHVQPYIIPIIGCFLGLIVLMTLSNTTSQDDENDIPARTIENTPEPEEQEENDDQPSLYDPTAIKVGTVSRLLFQKGESEHTLDLRYCGLRYLSESAIESFSLSVHQVINSAQFRYTPQESAPISYPYGGLESNTITIDEVCGYAHFRYTIEVFKENLTPRCILLRIIDAEQI